MEDIRMRYLLSTTVMACKDISDMTQEAWENWLSREICDDYLQTRKVIALTEDLKNDYSSDLSQDEVKNILTSVFDNIAAYSTMTRDEYNRWLETSCQITPQEINELVEENVIVFPIPDEEYYMEG